MSTLKTHLYGITLHSTYHLTACHQRMLGDERKFKNLTKDTKKVTCKRCRAYIQDKFRIYVTSIRRNGKCAGRWRVWASAPWLAERHIRDHWPVPSGAKITTKVYRGKSTAGVVAAE